MGTTERTRTVVLGEPEHKLLKAIIENVAEARHCLSVAEQIGDAYKENGDPDEEKMATTNTTFDILYVLVNLAE